MRNFVLRGALLSVSVLAISHAAANLENNLWIFHYQNSKIAFKPSTASPRGNPLIYLEEIVKKFSLKMSFSQNDFKITLLNPANQKSISFFTWSKTVAGDTWTAQLSRKIEFDQARPMVPLDFGDRALRPLLTGVPTSQARLSEPPKNVEVVIDPGHGGNDYGGAVKSGAHWIFEKDLNLLLGRELSEQLKALKISNTLTRETDAYLTLPERTRFANEQKATLFVSIHFNIDPNKDSKASGYELYVLSLKADDAKGRAVTARENQIIPDDLEEGFERALSDLRAEAHLESSIELAKTVKTLLNQTFKSTQRNIQMGPFYVLYGAEMPALLIEVGYLNSSADLKFILNDAKRKTFIEKLSSSLSQSLKQTTKKP